MSEEDQEISLNLSSSISEKDSFSKPKLTRKERLNKRRRRTLTEDFQEKSAPKTDGEYQHDKGRVHNRAETINNSTMIKSLRTGTSTDHGLNHRGVKRKRSDDRFEDSQRATTKHPRVVSLFRNMPNIPHFEGMDVTQVTEKMFSGKSFKELDLHPHMVSNLEYVLNATEMTEVQQRSIPWVIKGKDILVKSQTGSGKTLCYAVPIVHKLQSMTPKVSREDGVYAIVIVPTRELALQSLETFQKLTRAFTWIVPGAIMGGEKKKSEKSRLRKGINILVCTPGRLLDHLKTTKNLSVESVQWLVIDEADRLLEMGFQKDVSEIVSILTERGSSKGRNSILLSATLSKAVEDLACMSLTDPVRIDVVQSSDSQSSAAIGDEIALPENLSHHFMIVPLKLRLVTLAAFVLWKCKISNKRSKVLVFFSTQQSVDFHYDLFQNVLREDSDDPTPTHELNLFKLHGEMAQKERTSVFQDFSRLKDGVMLCTDVAARGLDMPRVKWIVQYSAPATPTDYVHRVGRTARIGGHGNALLFLLPSETEYIKELAKHKVKIDRVPMEDVLGTLDVTSLSISGWKVRTVEERCAALQAKFEEHVSKNEEIKLSARKAYQSAVRAYATYPSSVKSIFHLRSLHLGHMAKSFALQDQPTRIGEVIGRVMKKDAPPRKIVYKKPRTMTMSEFDSGLGSHHRKMKES